MEFLSIPSTAFFSLRVCFLAVAWRAKVLEFAARHEHPLQKALIDFTDGMDVIHREFRRFFLTTLANQKPIRPNRSLLREPPCMAPMPYEPHRRAHLGPLPWPETIRGLGLFPFCHFIPLPDYFF